MQNIVSADIQRPIQDVFILATDHIATWSGFVIESRPNHIAEDGGVGTTFLFTGRTPDGRTMQSEAEVVEYSPPTRSAFVIRGRYHEIKVAFDFEPLSEERTRTTQSWTLSIKGIPEMILGLAEPLFRNPRKRFAAAELDRLRAHCESGAPATLGGPETTPAFESG